VRLERTPIFLLWQNVLAYYNAGDVVVNSEVVQRIGSKSQSYDQKLQRQHCKNLQPNEYQSSYLD
jgi:hypothetical protein